MCLSLMIVRQTAHPQLFRNFRFDTRNVSISLHKRKKTGLGRAYVVGFKWALLKEYDFICEMDADFSHDPAALPTMFKLVHCNDFVVGSRYVPGGRIDDWGLARKTLSRLGSFYSRMVLGSKITDLTGGFNCWSRHVLENIDLNKIISNGYLFQIELKFRAESMGFQYIETPIIFLNRNAGSSKMTIGIIFEAITRIWILKIKSDTTLARLIKFCLTGILGVITNTLCFFILVDLNRIPYNIGAICGFAMAVTQNYFFNMRYTFHVVQKTFFMKIKGYIKFVIVSLVGLGVNISVLNILVPFFSLKTLAQLIGILSGVIFNFSGLMYLFNRKTERQR